MRVTQYGALNRCTLDHVDNLAAHAICPRFPHGDPNMQPATWGVTNALKGDTIANINAAAEVSAATAAAATTVTANEATLDATAAVFAPPPPCCSQIPANRGIGIVP